MEKDIYEEFIKAEEEWVAKIQEVFDKYFNGFKKDYEWMAGLVLVIKDRINQFINDKDIRYLYIKLRATITVWSKTLNRSDYEKFIEMTDSSCSAEIEVHS